MSPRHPASREAPSKKTKLAPRADQPASARRRAARRGGRKPAKRNASGGQPERISAVNAATLKPTQCSLWLRTPKPVAERNFFYRAFERAYAGMEQGYAGLIGRMVRVSGLVAGALTRVWDEAGMPDPGKVQGYSFDRAAGPPIVPLSLAAPLSTIECSQRISWQIVAAPQADLSV